MLQEAPGEASFFTTATFLYVKGPSLPTHSVIGAGLYIDRVSAGGKPPGEASHGATGPVKVETHVFPVDVHIYVMSG